MVKVLIAAKYAAFVFSVERGMVTSHIASVEIEDLEVASFVIEFVVTRKKSNEQHGKKMRLVIFLKW
jgi:hypothetical protein